MITLLHRAAFAIADVDLQDLCPSTKVHIYDMKRALRLPLGDYNVTKAILEGGQLL